MYTEKELLAMKKEVEDAKTSVSELKGQQTAVLNQLKNTYKCPSIEIADAEIGKARTKLANINKQIEEHSIILEENYNIE